MLPNRRRNKMKNYEKYAEEIRGYKGINFCSDFICKHILKIEDCDYIGCSRCDMLQLLWMLEDYEEPKEPEIDWSKVAVDTPILVRDNEYEVWVRRYFAKYEDAIVYVWNLGRTSWSATNDKDVSAWPYAKLAESEEAVRND